MTPGGHESMPAKSGVSTFLQRELPELSAEELAQPTPSGERPHPHLHAQTFLGQNAMHMAALRADADAAARLLPAVECDETDADADDDEEDADEEAGESVTVNGRAVKDGDGRAVNDRLGDKGGRGGSASFSARATSLCAMLAGRDAFGFTPLQRSHECFRASRGQRAFHTPLRTMMAARVMLAATGHAAPIHVLPPPDTAASVPSQGHRPSRRLQHSLTSASVAFRSVGGADGREGGASSRSASFVGGADGREGDGASSRAVSFGADGRERDGASSRSASFGEDEEHASMEGEVEGDEPGCESLRSTEGGGGLPPRSQLPPPPAPLHSARSEPSIARRLRRKHMPCTCHAHAPAHAHASLAAIRAS